MDSSVHHNFVAYAPIPQLNVPSNVVADHQHASVNDSAWPVSAHTTTTTNTPLTPAHSSMFSVPDRTADLDYPSPSPSSSNPNASPPYAHSQHVEQYPTNTHFNLVSMTSSNNENILDQFNQIESRVGPTRVMTRRQRAQMEQKILGRGIPLRHRLQRTEDDSLSRLNPSLYTTEMTRLHSNDEEPTQIQSDRLSPTTPASMPSPSYPYVYGNSRSTSGSTSNLQQAASPALSCATELSSISSASPSFSPYPRVSTHILHNTESLKPKQKKQRLDNSDRKQICVYHDKYPEARQEDIAGVFKVERSTISKILKHKSKWLNTQSQIDGVAKHRPSKFPDVEDEIERWLASCTIKKISITDSAIRMQAREIARQLGYPDEKFKASAGWVENFKTRHRIRGGIWQGRDDETRRVLSGPDALVSPLNFASASGSRTHHGLDVGTSSASPQDGMDSSQVSAGRGDRETLQAPEQRVTSSTSGSGQATWMDHTDTLQQPSIQSPLSAHPSNDQAQPVDHMSSHQSATQLKEHPVHAVHYAEPGLYYTSFREPIPTVEQANNALDIVIRYIGASARPDLIQPEERQALHTIKSTLLQELTMPPIDRSAHH